MDSKSRRERLGRWPGEDRQLDPRLSTEGHHEGNVVPVEVILGLAGGMGSGRLSAGGSGIGGRD